MHSLLFYKLFILDVRLFYNNGNYAYKAQSFGKYMHSKELKVYDPGLSPLPMQNLYSKLIFGIKLRNRSAPAVNC